MFTLYCSLLSVQKQYVQNNVHALIKKYFNAKNCWPLSEPSASHNLFGGGFKTMWELTKIKTDMKWAKNGSDMLAQHRVAANLQFVKNVISAKHSINNGKSHHIQE